MPPFNLLCSLYNNEVACAFYTDTRGGTLSINTQLHFYNLKDKKETFDHHYAKRVCRWQFFQLVSFLECHIGGHLSFAKIAVLKQKIDNPKPVSIPVTTQEANKFDWSFPQVVQITVFPTWLEFIFLKIYLFSFHKVKRDIYYVTLSTF